MFSYTKKVIRNIKIRNKTNSTDSGNEPEDFKITGSLEKNINKISEILGTSPDVVVRQFNFGYKNGLKGGVVMINGLCNTEQIESNILKPLMFDNSLSDTNGKNRINSPKDVFNYFVSFCDVKKFDTLNPVIDEVLGGSTAFFLDDVKEVYCISSKKWEKRAIEEPATENIIRGPREGFSETLRVNTSLVRRIVKNPNLRFERVIIGRQTKTEINIVYISGIANANLVAEVRRRLKKIDIDSVLGAGYIESFIQDAPYSIFATVGNSERPDTISSRLLEGRVAILIDGTPYVLTVPMVFWENFQSSEDYYTRSIYGSTKRIIRLLGYLITILAPAIYVALTTFHQELIPTTLLFALITGHRAIPFPSVVEAIIMLVIFDIMNEAGLRLPKPVGSAVSIVGALVLGESAVSAGLIGPFMVIVVALTAIASFVVPAEHNVTVIRYILVVVAGFMGGFGIVMVLLFLLIHMVSLKSFGTAYMAPVAPLIRSGQKDTFIRAFLWTLRKRPEEFKPTNKTRIKTDPDMPFENESGEWKGDLTDEEKN